MNQRLIPRLLSLALVAVPLGFWMASDAHRKATQMDADPIGYVNHLRLMRHESVTFHYLVILILLGVAFFVIEGVAALIERLLSRASSAA